MAESIIMHFRSASADAVAAEVDRLAVAAVSINGSPRWRYPTDDTNYTLTLDPYDDLLAEYEPEEVERLRLALGGLPAASLVVELRRSQGARAVDDAEEFVRRLVQSLDGLVDDTYSELWTRSEIEGGTVKRNGAFLACYRHP